MSLENLLSSKLSGKSSIETRLSELTKLRENLRKKLGNFKSNAYKTFNDPNNNIFNPNQNNQSTLNSNNNSYQNANPQNNYNNYLKTQSNLQYQNNKEFNSNQSQLQKNNESQNPNDANNQNLSPDNQNQNNHDGLNPNDNNQYRSQYPNKELNPNDLLNNGNQIKDNLVNNNPNYNTFNSENLSSPQNTNEKLDFRFSKPNQENNYQLQNLNKIVSTDNITPSIKNIYKNNSMKSQTNQNNANVSLINPNNQSTDSNNDDVETKKMLQELSELKKKNQMYLDKIQKLDTMSDKLKKQKQTDPLINQDYEQNLVNEMTKLKPKGMSEETLLNKIKSEVGQRNKLNKVKKEPINNQRIIKSSKFSINQTDYNKTVGRYGILTRMYFKNDSKINNNSDNYEVLTHNCQVVLNSRTLTIFESQSILNILSNQKVKFIKIKDLTGTSCFQINNFEDELVPGVTLCTINRQEKNLWIDDINSIIQSNNG